MTEVVFKGMISLNFNAGMIFGQKSDNWQIISQSMDSLFPGAQILYRAVS
jgi:hypothetical protein